MKVSIDDRRAQLLACAQAIAPLATNRKIQAVHVSKVEADHEIRRILDSIVRRWTKGVPASYESTSLSQGDPTDLDHVVPCRVIVDRMIMKPNQCKALLNESIVIAKITKAEHVHLGGIWAAHEKLYAEMLKAPVAQLHQLGLQRYAAKGIKLRALEGANAAP